MILLIWTTKSADLLQIALPCMKRTSQGLHRHNRDQRILNRSLRPNLVKYRMLGSLRRMHLIWRMHLLPQQPKERGLFKTGTVLRAQPMKCIELQMVLTALWALSHETMQVHWIIKSILTSSHSSTHSDWRVKRRCKIKQTLSLQEKTCLRQTNESWIWATKTSTSWPDLTFNPLTSINWTYSSLIREWKFEHSCRSKIETTCNF